MEGQKQHMADSRKPLTLQLVVAASVVVLLSMGGDLSLDGRVLRTRIGRGCQDGRSQDNKGSEGCSGEHFGPIGNETNDRTADGTAWGNF